MSQDRKEPIRFEGNQHVVREILDKVSRIRRELERYGLETDRGYRIAPALGGEIAGGFPSSRRGERRGTSAWDVSLQTER